MTQIPVRRRRPSSPVVGCVVSKSEKRLVHRAARRRGFSAKGRVNISNYLRSIVLPQAEQDAKAA